MASGSDDNSDRFSLVVGGPFHGLLSRLGLTGEDSLPTLQAALILALVAWLPPALLVALQSLADDSYSGWSFFYRLDGLYTLPHCDPADDSDGALR